jgi:hypothetical protein
MRCCLRKHSNTRQAVTDKGKVAREQAYIPSKLHTGIAATFVQVLHQCCARQRSHAILPLSAVAVSDWQD